MNSYILVATPFLGLYSRSFEFEFEFESAKRPNASWAALPEGGLQLTALATTDGAARVQVQRATSLCLVGFRQVKSRVTSSGIQCPVFEQGLRVCQPRFSCGENGRCEERVLSSFVGCVE